MIETKNASRNLASIVSIALLLVTKAALGQTATGGVSGVVTDINGNAIDSVIVMYQLNPGLSSGSVPPTGGMLAGTDGTFSFSNMASGVYSLCTTTPPAKSLLDSCEWTFSPPKVTVTAGQNLTGVQLVLQPGVRLQVRVNDLGKLLAIPMLNRTGASFETTFFDAGGFFHRLPLRSFDANGFNYEMVVPAAMPLTMQFRGAGLSVADGHGANVPFQGTGRPVVQIPAGSAPTLLTYSVGAAGGTMPTPTPTPTPPIATPGRTP